MGSKIIFIFVVHLSYKLAGKFKVGSSFILFFWNGSIQTNASPLQLIVQALADYFWKSPFVATVCACARRAKKPLARHLCRVTLRCFFVGKQIRRHLLQYSIYSLNLHIKSSIGTLFGRLSLHLRKCSSKSRCILFPKLNWSVALKFKHLQMAVWRGT